MIQLTCEKQQSLKQFTDENCAQASFCFSRLLKEKEIKVNGKKVVDWIKSKGKSAVRWVKNNKKIAIIIATSVLVAVLAVVLVCVLRSDTAERDDEDKPDWGMGITENIPCFSEKMDNFTCTDDYAAAYYSNVSSEQVEEYTARISEACGIQFQGQKYPRTAVYGDRIIALHYNVTEMRFSVTVARAGD